MATLYEINEAIMNCIDMETGELLDVDQIEQLEIEKDEKIENIALWYKNLVSDAEAYKAEKDSFAKKEKAAKNKAENLKRYLVDALQGSKFSTSRVNISFRKSEAVQCEDLDLVPEVFIVTELSLDKSAVKKALKDGIAVPGCELLEKQNLQIK